MAAEIRIGWIGLGNHSLKNLMPNLPAEARITAVCDRNPERIAEFFRTHAQAPAYCDFHEMAEKETLDAVFCVVSPAVHFEAGTFFARRGIPIFIEKTPCESLEQAECLLAAQRAGGSFPAIRKRCTASHSNIAKKNISSRPTA